MTAVGSLMQTQESGYFSISIDALRVDKVTAFDLYLPPRPGSAPVIYRKAQNPFDDRMRERLVRTGVHELLVPAEQRRAFQRYLEETLGEVLADQSLSLRLRCERLYESAQGLVKEVLEDPRFEQVRERSGRAVEHMTGFLFRESHSFQHLLKVTSFDYYTYTHSVNVYIFSTALAQQLGFGEEEVLRLGQGALLHDLGKSRIDPAILNCRGKLTPEMWNEMKLHPVHGHDILISQGETDSIILDVVRHHHEKLDGSGYPDGLDGDAVSPWVLITTIADIFDALTTERVYKSAMGTFPALQFMHRNMAGELHPGFFRAFILLMGQRRA